MYFNNSRGKSKGERGVNEHVIKKPVAYKYCNGFAFLVDRTFFRIKKCKEIFSRIITYCYPGSPSCSNRKKAQMVGIFQQA